MMHSTTRSVRHPLLFVLLPLMFVVACGSGAETSTSATLKVGVLAPLTGSLAPQGERLVSAIEIYVSQNASINGRDIELFVEDTEGVPEVAVRKAERLILENEVDVGMGVISSAVAIQVRDVFDRSEVPFIVTLANATVLSTEQKSDFVFRSSNSFYQSGLAAGTWVAEEMDPSTVFQSTWDYIGGQDVMDGFDLGFADAGGDGEIMAGTFGPFLQVEDFQPYISEALQADPDVVFAFYTGGGALNFVSQSMDFGLSGGNTAIVGLSGLTEESLLPQLGADADGVYAITTYVWELDTEGNSEFVEAFRDEWDDEYPSEFPANSYLAMQILGYAFQDLPADASAQDLAQAIDEVGSVDTIAGPIEMDPATNNPIRPFYVIQATMEEGAMVNRLVAEVGTFAQPSE